MTGPLLPAAAAAIVVSCCCGHFCGRHRSCRCCQCGSTRLCASSIHLSIIVANAAIVEAAAAAGTTADAAATDIFIVTKDLVVLLVLHERLHAEVQPAALDTANQAKDFAVNSELQVLLAPFQ